MERSERRVGILALQGDVREHAESFRSLGVETVEVRGAEDLEGICGLVIPGGESTAIGKALVESGMLDAIRTYFYTGGAVWGTCAGMILVSSSTTTGRQPLLGLMNAMVERNGFGRQVRSFEVALDVEGFDEPFPAVFIRAPYFEMIGPGVEALAEHEGRIVAARGENILVTAFHPELTDDVRFHEYFLEEVCQR